MKKIRDRDKPTAKKVAVPPLRIPLPPAPPAKKKGAVIDGIKVQCAYDLLMDVEELKKRAYPNNPNKHSDNQLILLADIYKQTGIRHTVIVSKLSGRIVAGHGRVGAADLVSLSKMPVDLQDFKDEAEERAFLLADNRIAELAERDESLVKGHLEFLQTEGLDLAFTGYTGKDLASIMDSAEETTTRKKEYDSFDDVPDELDGARSLKDDMVFESKALFNVPELREDMMGTLPMPIDTWAGPDASDLSFENYFYNITSVLRGLEGKRTVFGFYAEDFTFEGCWDDPVKFTSKLLNLPCDLHAVVMPNFSLAYNYPMAVNVWNNYRSKWYGRYMQEAGIKVIPDIPIVPLRLVDLVLAGVPKNPPAIAIQLHTSRKTDEELRVRRKFCQMVEERLRPKRVLIYGGDHIHEEIKGCFTDKVKLAVVQSRLVKRRALMEKNKSGKTAFKK